MKVALVSAGNFYLQGTSCIFRASCRTSIAILYFERDLTLRPTSSCVAAQLFHAIPGLRYSRYAFHLLLFEPQVHSLVMLFVISDLHYFCLLTHAHVAHFLLEAKDVIVILLDIQDLALSSSIVFVNNVSGAAL